MNTDTKHTAQGISRRNFLRLSGGITFVIAAQGILPGCQSAGEADAKSSSVSPWVHLHTDGGVTIFNPAAEMGQGSMTALAVIIAEELDADWEKVRIEASPIEPDTYGLTWGGELGGSMITVGSRTVRGYYAALRNAGAQARYVLMKKAADAWEVPVEEISTEPGQVIHAGTGKSMGFGELAEMLHGTEIDMEIPEVTLKDPSDFRLIGKVLPRRDIVEKVNGTAQFALDVHLPGMVYGMIARSPVHGATPSLTNEKAIREMPGIVEIVPLDYGIGVIAESVEQALKAKNALDIQWKDEVIAVTHNSDEAYGSYATRVGQSSAQGEKITDEGNADAAFRSASKTYLADYKNDYVYHAQMEPLNAVVSVAEDGKSAEVWAGSQAHDGARGAAAEALGLDFSDINYHPCYLGGGFGRRSMSDYVTEAALLAKAVKRPLKLIWTREDDLQYGAFRPTSLQRLRAGVDQNGDVVGWSHIITGPGDGLLTSGAETPFYTIPNKWVERRAVDHGVRTKHWRGVGHGPNKYAIESFIDEIATDLGKDPVEFRLRLMREHPRARKVLQTAADMADWGTSSPRGRAKGVAFAERSGSLSAGVAEISFNEAEGMIRVHRFWASLDAGVVVQPDNAIAQMEGGIIMGISSVLKESITFKAGKVQQSNFHDYPLLRISEAPESIEVKIIESQEAPTGIGESGVPIVGGAIANAFAALTGKRLRHMPFTPQNVGATSVAL